MLWNAILKYVKKQVSRDSGLAHKIQNRRTITVKLQD